MVSDLLFRLRALVRRKTVENELDDELRFHFDHQVEKLVHSGVPPDEARRRARLIFGGDDPVKEECRQAWGIHLLETCAQDIRYGARMLYRNAEFTLVAVLTLALGIGINVVFFTAYKAFFLRPLDARDPGQMVNLGMVLRTGDSKAVFSYPDYEAYRDRLHSFSGLIAAGGDNVILSDAGGSAPDRRSTEGSLSGLLPPLNRSNKERAATAFVSENYFSVLGIAPVRGRIFGNASELAASPEVLISENYLERRFGGDPALLGKTIRLNGVAVTIVGITPPDFAGTSIDVPDFWLPFSLAPLVESDSHQLTDREHICCRLFGRLAPGTRMDQAQAEMNVLAGHLRTLHDPHSDWGKPSTAFLWPGSQFLLPIDRLSGGFKYAVLLILGAVGTVLIIACANVASLQLARSMSRKNELSMRLSLGASRRRLVRQLLTESALLGLLAGLVALAFSWILTKGLANMAAQALPAQYGTLIFHVTPDLGILAYVFAVSLTAGILFGLGPALESSRSALPSALKANAGTSPVRSRRLHDLFIGAQVAVALALLIAAGMLIHSSIHALQVDRGYDTKNIIALQVPDDPKYAPGRKAAVVSELRARLASLPGVAAITNGEAPFQGGRQATVGLNGEVPTAQSKRALIDYSYVEPNYFELLGIPLLFGHNFQAQAGQKEASVIVSESAAQQLWPGQNPIGRTLRLGTDGLFHGKGELTPDGPLYQVIGVTGDTHGATFDDSDSKHVYLRLPEDRLQDHAILIRTHSDAKQIMPELFPLISSLDPDLEVNAITLEDIAHFTASIFLPTFAATIASPVGLIGLLLAAMGIYGTVSYIVVLRTREVGVRMALGAQKGSILGLMLRQSMRPVLAGLFAGMLLATGASFLLRGALHGLHAVDPLSFGGVSALFTVVSLLAAYVPSRRAMRVDPVVALRYE